MSFIRYELEILLKSIQIHIELLKKTIENTRDCGVDSRELLDKLNNVYKLKEKIIKQLLGS